MKNLILLLFLFNTNFLFAQNYILLAEDAKDDPTISGILDLRAISYAIDESMDSLWFKIETHTSLPNDLGIVFGVDTDLVPANGLAWNSSNNSELSPEVVFTINRNLIAPGSLYGFSNNNLNQQSTFGDSDSTIIVNMQLSQLDDDGRFNFVLGSSSFDADTNLRPIYDDLPDKGFFTIDLTSAISTISDIQAAWIYPNPVIDHFQLGNLENGRITAIKLFNNQGQLIDLGNDSNLLSAHFDVAHLEAGIYFLQVEDKNGLSNFKFVKL